jgi:preprotein translocase subunit SecY
MFGQNLINLWKNTALRKKLFFVLLILAIFRLLANIPVPGVDTSRLEEFFNQSQVLGLLNIFSGGALAQFSIVMLGMGPYITAVIGLQLATMIFPALERIYKEEGEAGKKRFNRYGRWLTAPLALLQGYGMLALLQSQGVVSSLSSLTIVAYLATVMAGALMLMWLGELITEQGVGNGVSIMIFAGIIARTPVYLQQLLVGWNLSQLGSYILFGIIALVMIALVVLVNEARRNVPVSYTKRVKGRRMYGGTSTYLPIPLNPAGVMPIIFALALLMFPQMISQAIANWGSWGGQIAQGIEAFLTNPWSYNISYFLLVVGFAFFYTQITFDPGKIADNLQKSGGFIPGIRPGKSTAQKLKSILYRCLFVGAIFLGLVAIMPSLIQGMIGMTGFTFLIGGTALLIVVSVVLETMRQIKAQMKVREYESF